MEDVSLNSSPVPSPLSWKDKYLGLIAKWNLILLGVSGLLVMFVIMSALEPLRKGKFFDPLVLMSVCYLLALVFGILALRKRFWLILVAIMYVGFFFGDWMDMKRTEEGGKVFCAEIRADSNCAWSPRHGFVCEGGAHAGIIPPNMCPQYGGN